MTPAKIRGDAHRVRRANLDDLHEDQANARRHDERNLHAIKDSLKAHGQVEPLVVQASTGRVIGGNGRLVAMRDLGWTHAYVVDVDVDDHEATRLALALNRTAELAAWDDEVLAQLLEDVEIEPTMWNDDELSALLESLEDEPVVDEDAVVAPVDDPETQVGDKWILGDHVVACGDCFALAGDVLEVEADAVFTDPPYNVDLGQIKHPKFTSRPIAGDNQDAVAWGAFCDRVAALVKSATNGCIYVCHSSGPDGRILARALDEALHWSATVTWVKDAFVLGRGKYQRRYEPIWFGWRDNGKRFRSDRDLDDVWEFPRPKASPEHPTMKPVALVANALHHATRKGDTVFDPFLGSGTTLVAAEQTERRCVGIELEPGYVEAAVERWQQLTGLTGKRVEGVFDVDG